MEKQATGEWPASRADLSEESIRTRQGGCLVFEQAGKRIAVSRKTSSNCHVPSFTISARGEQGGFEIEVVGYDGVPEQILGFETLAEAEAWVVRRAYRAAGSLIRPAFACCGASNPERNGDARRHRQV
jgi:hypothetical protein